MELEIQHRPGPVRVTVQGPGDSEELQQIVTLLQSTADRLWLGTANLCFVGGALLFGWFAGVPLWGGVLLAAFLQLGLGLMWFGDRFALKMDSAQLTRELKQYQNRLQK